MADHPMQATVRDKHRVVRFRANKIVEHLIRVSPDDLNKLATMGFSDEDWRQLAQMNGYSVDGYCDLSYVDAQARRKAVRRLRG